jgi:hypothetical protein
LELFGGLISVARAQVSVSSSVPDSKPIAAVVRGGRLKQVHSFGGVPTVYFVDRG